MPSGSGMPGMGTAQGKVSVPQLDSTQMAQVVQWLWSPTMIDHVARQIQSQQNLAVRPSLLQLASAMPFPKIRSSLAQLVQQHGAQGPQAWRGRNWELFDAAEPGILFAVRQAPRQSRSNPRPGGRGGRPGGNPYGGVGGFGGFPGGSFPPGAGGPAPQGNGGKQDPKVAWNDATEDLIFRFCSRFAQSGVRSPSKGDPKTLPIRIPSAYTVVQQYHCSLPQDVPGGLAKQRWPRLKVHFLRLTRKGALNTVARPFERKTKRHPSYANSYWFEYFQQEGNRLVSMDILVYPKPGQAQQAPRPRRGRSRSRGSRGRGQEFIVDVLYLEVAR